MTPNTLAKLKADVLEAVKRGDAEEATRLVREASEHLSVEELQAFTAWAQSKTLANLRRWGGRA